MAGAAGGTPSGGRGRFGSQAVVGWIAAGLGLFGLIVILIYFMTGPAGAKTDQAKADVVMQQRLDERERQKEQRTGERRAAPEARYAVYEKVEKWARVKLTPEIKIARPKRNSLGSAIEGSDQVVAHLMSVDDHAQLEFTFAGNRTGWIFHPEGSTVDPSAGTRDGRDGVLAEVAPGYGTVPGAWVRWQKIAGNIEGVYVRLTSLGEHRR